MNAPKIGFAGTPRFAAHILKGLIDNGLKPALVLCQPDRAKGRGKKPTPGPVKQLAMDLYLEICQPESLKGDAGNSACLRIAELNLDILVVAAYGLILPEHVLKLPKYGCLNVHASLLPKWRGAAPIERSIWSGDQQSGVSIMKMDKGMDTGPVYRQFPCEITNTETGDSLHDKLANIGISATITCLAEIEVLEPLPQNAEQASYAPKLRSAESLLDWSQDAESLNRQVRALFSRQPAYSFIDGERVRILSAEVAEEERPADVPPGTITGATKSGCRVQTGRGILILLSIQLNRGKGKSMPFSAALNGYPRLFTNGCFSNGE